MPLSFKGASPRRDHRIIHTVSLGTVLGNIDLAAVLSVHVGYVWAVEASHDDAVALAVERKFSHLGSPPSTIGYPLLCRGSVGEMYLLEDPWDSVILRLAILEALNQFNLFIINFDLYKLLTDRGKKSKSIMIL